MSITNTTKVAKHDQNNDVDDNVDPAARPTRRILSVEEEKLDILARYEDCEPGQKGAFARSEGVYSSQLTEWRRARDAGTLGKRSTRTRGENREIEKLTKKNQRLEDELERTRLALDIVGKTHALLEKLSKSADNE